MVPMGRMGEPEGKPNFLLCLSPWKTEQHLLFKELRGWLCA